MRTASSKGNSARKILSFYRVNFGHEPPYQVLVDGNTIQTSLSKDLYIKQSLPQLLGAPTHIVVTSCIVKELRSKGADYSGATLFAKRATRLECTHEGRLPESECISSRLKAPPDGGIILASSETSLVKMLVGIPAIPLISILNLSKFVLKPPSPATLRHVQSRQSDKTGCLSSLDKALVEKVRAEEQAKLDARHANIRKRKRAKGPNPLSMCKSKKKVNQIEKATAAPDKQPAIAPLDQLDADVLPMKNVGRKRKRKRRRGSNPVANDSDSALAETQSVMPAEGPVLTSENVSAPARKRRRRATNKKPVQDGANAAIDTRGTTNGKSSSQPQGDTVMPKAVPVNSLNLSDAMNTNGLNKEATNVGVKNKTRVNENGKDKQDLNNKDAVNLVAAEHVTSNILFAGTEEGIDADMVAGEDPDDKPNKKKQRRNRRRRPKKVEAGAD